VICCRGDFISRGNGNAADGKSKKPAVKNGGNEEADRTKGIEEKKKRGEK
jgi:hypothetical protein